MKTALQIDLTFEQILSMVRQLPRQQKIKLTKELEKEESEIVALKKAIEKGLDSPRVENFDFDEHLIKLKSEKKGNG